MIKEHLKVLLETIAEMAEHAECDLVVIEAIANNYGFTINENLVVEEKRDNN